MLRMQTFRNPQTRCLVRASPIPQASHEPQASTLSGNNSRRPPPSQISQPQFARSPSCGRNGEGPVICQESRPWHFPDLLWLTARAFRRQTTVWGPSHHSVDPFRSPTISRTVLGCGNADFTIELRHWPPRSSVPSTRGRQTRGLARIEDWNEYFHGQLVSLIGLARLQVPPHHSS
jgi:hypothetical protein